MNPRPISDILNDLLSAERESLAERLLSAEHYVSWPIAGRFASLRRIVDDEHEHEAWLTDAILRLGAAPRPTALSIDTAATHYLDWQFMLPRIIADKRHIIAAYQAALSRVPSNSPAGATLARILARHESHVAALSQPAIPTADAPS